MNVSMKHKLTHRHKEQTCGYQMEGEGQTGSLGLVDVNYHIQTG